MSLVVYAPGTCRTVRLCDWFASLRTLSATFASRWPPPTLPYCYSKHHSVSKRLSLRYIRTVVCRRPGYHYQQFKGQNKRNSSNHQRAMAA